MNFEILEGDVLSLLPMLPDNYFQTCVTSPPYWGLRDYGKEGQLGLESTFEEFVANQARIFRDVRRVLKPNGTLWLNMGDSYAQGGRKSQSNRGLGKQQTNKGSWGIDVRANDPPGIKQKDLLGQPWALAFALRDDGWYLRSDIIWAKPNPMPESIQDRPTKSHEYVFLLSKSPTYFYDIDAIREPLADASLQRISQPTFDLQTGGPKDPQNGGEGSPNRSARKAVENLKKRMPAGWATHGNHNVVDWATEGRQGRKRLDKEGPNSRMHFDRDPAHRKDQKKRKEFDRDQHRASFMDGHSGFYNADGKLLVDPKAGRNKRTVWNIATQAFPEAHFATFPEELARTCILAGSKIGDMVLDPYSGSGTTGLVACGLGRGYVGIEINPEYADMSRRRIGGPLFAGVQ